jgi:hypothetical protein
MSPRRYKAAPGGSGGGGVALSSRDVEAHRRMLEQADALNAGTAISTELWSTMKARLGL